MSASLVGSEMCIRDRKGPPGGGSARPVVAKLPPALNLFRPAEACGERGPVSYTHLTLPTICSV
eukprot:12015784-Alexandrium_andersonii.AAC.1